MRILNSTQKSFELTIACFVFNQPKKQGCALAPRRNFSSRHMRSCQVKSKNTSSNNIKLGDCSETILSCKTEKNSLFWA